MAKDTKYNFQDIKLFAVTALVANMKGE